MCSSLGGSAVGFTGPTARYWGCLTALHLQEAPCTVRSLQCSVRLLFNRNTKISFFKNMDHFLKSLLNSLQHCFCYHLLVLRYVGSQLPDQGLDLHPCTGRSNLNHRTREGLEILNSNALNSINLFCTFLCPAEETLPSSPLNTLHPRLLHLTLLFTTCLTRLHPARSCLVRECCLC